MKKKQKKGNIAGKKHFALCLFSGDESDFPPFMFLPLTVCGGHVFFNWFILQIIAFSV